MPRSRSKVEGPARSVYFRMNKAAFDEWFNTIPRTIDMQDAIAELITADLARKKAAGAIAVREKK